MRRAFTFEADVGDASAHAGRSGSSKAPRVMTLPAGPRGFVDVFRWDRVLLRAVRHIWPEKAQVFIANVGRGIVLDSDWSGVKFHDCAIHQLIEGSKTKEFSLPHGKGILGVWHASDTDVSCQNVLRQYKDPLRPAHIFNDVTDYNTEAVNQDMKDMLNESVHELDELELAQKQDAKREVGLRLALAMFNKVSKTAMKNDVHCLRHGRLCPRRWVRPRSFAHGSFIRNLGTPCDTWSSCGKQQQFVHWNTAGLVTILAELCDDEDDTDMALLECTKTFVPRLKHMIPCSVSQ